MGGGGERWEVERKRGTEAVVTSRILVAMFSLFIPRSTKVAERGVTDNGEERTVKLSRWKPSTAYTLCITQPAQLALAGTSVDSLKMATQART